MNPGGGENSFVVGITGASGAILGVRLVEELLRSGAGVAAILSAMGREIVRHEVTDGAPFEKLADVIRRRDRSLPLEKLREYGDGDLFAPVASGTSSFTALIIMPCSMKTLAAVASGYSASLITRAADVALKEGRRCVLAPRETPLGLVHLENMLRARRAGADILVPAPAFYTRPHSVEDMIDFVVGKALNLLGVEHSLFRPWGEA